MSCFRCGRSSHFVRDCFAKFDVDGNEIDAPLEDEPIPQRFDGCLRCGRSSHDESNCFAKVDVDGCFLQSTSQDSFKRKRVSQFEESPPYRTPKSYSSSRSSRPSRPKKGVYVLRLENRNIYVGQSQNVDKRIATHMGGYGAEWTKRHPVVEVEEPLTDPMDDLESWERAETIEQALIHGIQKVRGHQWTMVKLSSSEVQSFQRQVCERHQLCRRCGKDGHLIRYCPGRGVANWMLYDI
mmetsp:Transcript_23733/g.32389  ORF Transcript_23733/g.32389 Transcript_23733/m.32389 type:complete len:239 (+) Transcript_23733:44-760(+)